MSPWELADRADGLRWLITEMSCHLGSSYFWNWFFDKTLKDTREFLKTFIPILWSVGSMFREKRSGSSYYNFTKFIAFDKYLSNNVDVSNGSKETGSLEN